jgi:hypothetical protein
MTVLAAILGCCILALVLVDAFNTLVLARRTEHVFRIARAYYRLTWNPFAAIARRIQARRTREAFLSIFGPLSLLVLFGLWAIGLVLAFGLLQWALRMQPASLPGTFWNDLYLSASTLFTLSTGDPKNASSKLIAVIQGGLGLAFLSLVIGYLPVLYESFSKRELRISLLDARAGSPPSAGALLQSAPSTADRLERQLATWEEWSAQVLENQLSFPMLAYFRSQHSNQSWLTALVAMIDCAAVVSLCSKDDLQRQADFTFAMGRHVLADIAVVFGLTQESPAGQEKNERLPDSEFAKLQQIIGSRPALFDARRCSLSSLRSRGNLYEAQATALSSYFLMSLPSWISDESRLDNWRVPVTEREEIPFAVSDPFTASADDAGARKES